MIATNAVKKLADGLLKVAGVFLTLLVLPGLFQIQCYAVVSGSMEPALPVGCAVYVQKKTPETIKEGQIITFLTNQSGTRVTHRVVKCDFEKHIFITKGDANEQEDAVPVRWENVCGVEIGCIPYVGYILEFLSNRNGKMAVIFFFLMLFLCSEVFTAVRLHK